jgi:hypothetical protein
VDNLLVLVKGGQLAFFGRQPDAMEFFGVQTTDKIFQKFGAMQHDWPPKFRQHPSYELREIATRDFDVADSRNFDAPAASNPLAMFWRQFSTLTTRYTKVKLRDTSGMFVIGLQPPILALVMAIVFMHRVESDTGVHIEFVPTQAMIFMLSLSCMWFGMSTAVRELIADQVVFRRERRVGVRVLPYVSSKVAVLGVITALQSIFLTAIMYFVFGLGETSTYNFELMQVLWIGCLTTWLGMGLGLAMSSVTRSSEAAVGMLPLLLIPQIAFSSIMFAIRDMHHLAKKVTWINPSRFTFDAFLKCGERIAVRTRRGDFDDQPIQGTLWKLGLKVSDSAEDQGLSIEQLTVIMIGLIFALLLFAFARVWSRGND